MRSILITMAAGALLAAGCNNEQAKAPENTKPVAAEVPSDSSVAAARKGPASSASRDSGVSASPNEAKTAAKRITAEMAATKGQGALPLLEPVEAGTDDKDGAKNIRPEDVPQEGDQVMIPPQLLSKLLPGFNFDKVDRKDPINVRELLESQGIVLTNYQQLAGMGITNWSIVRAQKPPQPAASEQ